MRIASERFSQRDTGRLLCPSPGASQPHVPSELRRFGGKIPHVGGPPVKKPLLVIVVVLLAATPFAAQRGATPNAAGKAAPGAAPGARFNVFEASIADMLAAM